MHFLADENVSRLVVERLRADGHDVISVAQFGQGASDERVVELARRKAASLSQKIGILANLSFVNGWVLPA